MDGWSLPDGPASPVFYTPMAGQTVVPAPGRKRQGCARYIRVSPLGLVAVGRAVMRRAPRTGWSAGRLSSVFLTRCGINEVLPWRHPALRESWPPPFISARAADTIVSREVGRVAPAIDACDAERSATVTGARSHHSS
jgi:hypothetical protein